MRAPLSFLHPATARRAWLGALALTLLIGAILLIVGRPMTADGGADILRYELAPDAARANAILDEWGDTGRAAARSQTILDYAFLVAYGATVALAGLLVSRRAAARGRERAAGLVAVAGWAGVAAAACDAVENVFLLRQLGTGATDATALAASTAATLKFALLLAALSTLAAVAIGFRLRRT